MKYLCLLLFSMLVLMQAHICHAATFLVGTEDVPLMPDFQISEDDTFWLDAQDGSGRLFFAKAYTNNAESAVKSFYSQTLPELGWQEEKDGYFKRDGDILKISVDGHSHKTAVIFELITK